MAGMNDAARKWTDAELESLERRIQREYFQAAREMRGKQAKWLEKFNAEREMRERALDSTPEALEAHERWLQSQAARSEWLDGMASELSAAANAANVRAAEMVNDFIPVVYCENANRAAFAVDKALRVDTAYALADESTVRRLIEMRTQGAMPEQLMHETVWFIAEEGQHQTVRKRLTEVRGRMVDHAKDIRWNRQKFTSAITQGILQGESIPRIVKRTESIFGANLSAAVRAARTACTCAENAGRMDSYQRASDLGIDMVQEWMATMDDRTRESHRVLDGVQVEVGEPWETENGPIAYPGDPAADPAETYNCFIGSTAAIPLGGVERSFRRFYDGDVVAVKTARGVEFISTPNHPILTTDGWIPAGELHEGDRLFVADLGRGFVGPEPDVEHVGPSIEAIHELASLLAVERVGGLAVNFHEDVIARNVDVVTDERPLRVDPETIRLEPSGEIALEHDDPPAPRHGGAAEFFDAPLASPDGRMGGAGEPGTLLGGGVGHALVHSLGAVPGRDSRALEPESDGVATDVQLLCESLDGLSAVVLLDDVVGVDVHLVSCHVYNLQTESGAYLVSGSGNSSLFAVSHNCRCSVRGRVKGFEGRRPDRWDSLPSGITYEEWKAGKNAEGEALTYSELMDRRRDG